MNPTIQNIIIFAALAVLLWQAIKFFIWANKTNEKKVQETNEAELIMKRQETLDKSYLEIKKRRKTGKEFFFCTPNDAGNIARQKITPEQFLYMKNVSKVATKGALARTYKPIKTFEL